MSFKIPSLAETRDLLIAVFKALFPDRNVGAPRSYHARRVTVLAAATTQVHAHVKSAQDDAMPDTAGDDGPIDRWGAIVGTLRKGATPARKSAAGRVRGTIGTPIPALTQLKHPPSGLLFQVSAAATIPAALFIDVDIVGVSLGAETRLAANETLEFVATPVGLETQVILQKDLDEDGYDDEQFGAYRRRVLATFSTPASGGSGPDYVKWALAAPGLSIVAAYCYPNRAGLGTVDIAALHAGSGNSRLLDGGAASGAENAALAAYLKTLAPAEVAAAPGALRVLNVTYAPTNVEIKIVTNDDPAYAFDWPDATPLVVLAVTPATRLVQFTTARPAQMKAGHRVMFGAVASSADGSQWIIESLSGTDSIILTAWPTGATAPAPTDLVYSGGPLVDPIRNAIVSHMNGEIIYAGKNAAPLAESALVSTIGLEPLCEGVGTANAGPSYGQPYFGTWLGGLTLGNLQKIANFKAGVRAATIITPIADIFPSTFIDLADDLKIGCIAPGFVSTGYILVRKG